jgi:cytochrome c biogenesis protein CcmG, thiol:disulfide interchange protein DsbE
MSNGSEPAPGLPEHTEADVLQSGKRGGGFLRGGKRPGATVILLVAACAAIVAAVITVDATAHRPKAVTEPPAPAFTLPSLRDPARQVSLSAYRGRPVIVNFFASWCGPCQRETSILASFYRASRGSVVIIGVDADDSASAARRFLQVHAVTYPVGFESTPAVADAYGVSAIGIPETFFLDSRHRIVKRIFGDVTMRTLAEGAALMNRHPAGLASAAGAASHQNRG